MYVVSLKSIYLSFIYWGWIFKILSICKFMFQVIYIIFIIFFLHKKRPELLSFHNCHTPNIPQTRIKVLTYHTNIQFNYHVFVILKPPLRECVTPSNRMISPNIWASICLRYPLRGRRPVVQHPLDRTWEILRNP